ncbi:MAG: ACP S-malonyltransferase [Clostridiales bacterium]|jgi:[acyl-carrier-protein] S-malonyltransferase|nr:ACP S-malonyltransferase [Clostridiales bacterium]
MKNVAVMFSGQGAQKSGMGKEFYDNFDICKRTFDEAGEALKMDIAALCFEADDRLNMTEFAQPALLTASIAAYRLLQSEGIRPDVLMGLSLGEYSALCAAGAVDFADAVRLVHRRGRIMTEFAAAGGMLAAVGLSREVLEDICASAEDIGFAACANFNTHDQIVLAGEKAALDFCAQKIKAAGGKALALKVSGPFHTKLLQAAADVFKEELMMLKVSKNSIPVISNLTADVFNTENYVEQLTRHMTSPVRWVECVQKAKSMGIATFIELGSGKTLVNFVMKIDENLEAFAIENLNDMEGLRERKQA